MMGHCPGGDAQHYQHVLEVFPLTLTIEVAYFDQHPWRASGKTRFCRQHYDQLISRMSSLMRTIESAGYGAE